MLKKWHLSIIFVFFFFINYGNVYADKLSVNLNVIDNGKNSKVLLPPPSYSTHYIAPAPWQYWNKANEIIITTLSTSIVEGEVYKSDGTPITKFSCIAGSPFSYRFTGLPKETLVWPLNTVVSSAGLIVVAEESISVNLRNVASDNLLNDGGDANIKGNASLFSFGDAAIGTSFRVGYYRNGFVFSSEVPIYSIMAINDNTTIKINGITTATLNKGQSYLFNAAIGTLVESSAPSVMNTSARLDAPGGCGDGAFNPIPPVESLGNEYVVVRGEGNLIAEQTTVVATEPNTIVNVKHFDENGLAKGDQKFTLVNKGDFKTFNHGYIQGTYNVTNNTGRYSSSHILADKNIGVFSGTAGISVGGGCEVDVATLVPISACSGSKRVETLKFISYRNTDLPYFGYLITKSDDRIFLTTSGGNPNYTDVDIETIPSIVSRKALGGTGLSLIKFTNLNIGSPKVISISSAKRITVSMVQQSSAFSMSNFISRFPEKSDQPTVYQQDCSEATLTASPESIAPFQWYLNGVKIDDAISSTYLSKTSGNYSLTSMLECGLSAQSLPLNISICNIDRAITKTVNIAYPPLNSNVVFTLKAENLGDGLATGVSVKDLLPTGYVFVSSNAPAGTTYDPITGNWNIGDLASQANLSLEITAKVVQIGKLVNEATITGQQIDKNISNDKSEAITVVESLDRTVCIGIVMDPIRFTVADNNYKVTGLPLGLDFSIDTKIITISGTPSKVGTFDYFLEEGSKSRIKKGTITIRANVGSPVFNAGLTDSRCQGASTESYTATATDAIGIVYSLSPFSAGIINSSTGELTWSSTFTGQAIVTATAKGCAEKKEDFVVTVNPLPNLTLSETDVCEGSTSFDLLYKDVENNPVSYSVIWTNNQFPIENNQPFHVNSIPVSIPANASLGMHTGRIILLNDKNCSREINFNITIKEKPLTPHILLITDSQY